MPADERDFAAFVDARQRSLQRLALLLTGDWASAEDLTQTALMSTWAHWSRVRSDDPYAYVRRSLVNAYASRRRRRWRGEIPHGQLPEPAGARDRAAETDVRLTVLDALVRRLTRRQRAVVVLRFYEDMTQAQVAAVLGIAVGTVKSTTATALARLREDPALADVPAVPEVPR